MANSASAPSSGASGPASGMSAVPQALLHASPRATSTSPKLHTRTCDDVFVVKWRWPSPVTSLLRPPSSTVLPPRTPRRIRSLQGILPHSYHGPSRQTRIEIFVPSHRYLQKIEGRRGQRTDRADLGSRSSFLDIGIFRRSRGGEGDRCVDDVRRCGMPTCFGLPSVVLSLSFDHVRVHLRSTCT